MMPAPARPDPVHCTSIHMIGHNVKYFLSVLRKMHQNAFYGAGLSLEWTFQI